MGLRPKTKRRLTILLSLCAVLGIVLGIAINWRMRQLNERTRQLRASALAAFSQKDYVTALERLSGYITPERAIEDTEAFFALAKSRRMVRMPDEKNLLECRNYLRELLNRKPDYAPAQDELLDLYDFLNWDTEAVTLADQVLEQRADSGVALRVKSQALSRQGKTEQALAVALKASELAPSDLPAQVRTMELMRQHNRTPAEIIARATSLRDKFPSESKFEILVAVAHFMTNDREQAARTLRGASLKGTLDPDSVVVATRMFDAMGLYSDSMNTLDRAAGGDVRIMRMLQQRLWQQGRYQQVVDQLNAVDLRNRSTPAMLLGLKALSLEALGKADQVKELLATLQARSSDEASLQWAAVLKMRQDNSTDFRAAVQFYRDVLHVEDNAIFRWFLVEALIAQGERELAIQECSEVIELAPSWAQPRVAISQLLLDAKRYSDARFQAEMACKCAPQIVAPNVNLVKVWHRQLQEQNDPQQQNELLRFVFRLQQQMPGEAQTLPIYIDLLARTNQREAAVNALTTALSARTAPPTETLVSLAAINAEHKLGVEDLISARLGVANVAASPDAAFELSRQQAVNGHPAEGLAMLKSAMGNNSNDPAWRLAMAQYLELTQDPQARATWIALGDRHPNDLSIQKAIIKLAQSAESDRSFMQRSIQRVRQLTGDDAVDWRLAQAQLLMQTPAGDSSYATSMAQAGETLSDLIRTHPRLIEARVLQAQLLATQNDLSGATDQLRAASNLDPANAPVALSLLDLLKRQNQLGNAQEVLDRVLSLKSTSAADRLHAIEMLAESGQASRAVDLLRDEMPPTEDLSRRLLLARLCLAVGQEARAESIYRAMYTDKTTTQPAVRAASEYLAPRGDVLAARQMLTRLDELKLEPGQKELMLASFADRFGTAESAAKIYLDATRAAPNNVDVWRALIVFHLRHDQFALARDFADQAVKANPSNPAVADLARLANVVEDASGSGDLKSLLSNLKSDPQANAPAIEALGLLVELRSRNITPAELAVKMRAVSQKYPQSTGVQSIAAQTCASVHQWDAAIEIANRAMNEFATEVEPARLATRILSSAGRFEQARKSAEQWRNRSMTDPVQADIALAEICLAQRDSAGAIARLGSYVQPAQADPQKNVDVLMCYSRALIACGRSDEAWKLMQPMAKESASWRAKALELCAAFTDAKPAAGWVEQIASLQSKDSREEQIALAGAWYNLAQQSGDVELLGKARQALLKAVEKESNSSGVWMMLAATQQLGGDLPEAERAYRMALSIDPANAVAQNNLAYVLFLRNQKLEEALRLADRACTSMPDMAGFHDTRARLQVKLGRISDGIESYQRALTLDDASIDSLIGLADALNRNGQKSAATARLDQIEVRVKTAAKLSPYVAEQLDELRKNLNGSSAGTQ